MFKKHDRAFFQQTSYPCMQPMPARETTERHTMKKADPQVGF
jgi:hypothetical protein